MRGRIRPRIGRLTRTPAPRPARIVAARPDRVWLMIGGVIRSAGPQRRRAGRRPYRGDRPARRRLGSGRRQGDNPPHRREGGERRSAVFPQSDFRIGSILSWFSPAFILACIIKGVGDRNARARADAGVDRLAIRVIAPDEVAPAGGELTLRSSAAPKPSSFAIAAVSDRESRVAGRTRLGRASGGPLSSVHSIAKSQSASPPPSPRLKPAHAGASGLRGGVLSSFAAAGVPRPAWSSARRNASPAQSILAMRQLPRERQPLATRLDARSHVRMRTILGALHDHAVPSLGFRVVQTLVDPLQELGPGLARPQFRDADGHGDSPDAFAVGLDRPLFGFQNLANSFGDVDRVVQASAWQHHRKLLAADTAPRDLMLRTFFDRISANSRSRLSPTR